MRRPLVTAATCALLFGACSSDQGVTATSSRPIGAPDGTDGSPNATLDWGACDDPAASDPDLECATLTVPLDYEAPDGDTIELALVRLPATDDREGAVLLNPGGPGASGFELATNAASALQSEMGLEAFDIVGFDPRGVDRSNGIRCLTDAEVEATVYLDSSPDTPEEEATLDAADAQFDTACIAKYGVTLRHYSTDNTARDMDAIRAAMGDDTMTYLGISYGTYLGATYATLFPDRVRALVLDAAFEPTGDSVEEQYTTQLVGFEEAFDNWAAWCEGTDECSFSAPDVSADWDALSDALDADPAPASARRQANQEVMGVATIAALYSEADWPVLADALTAGRDGDGDALLRLADSYVGRSADGTYSTIEQSGTIIRCASGLDPDQPDDPEALVATLQELSPRFSEGISAADFTDGCAALMPDVAANPLAYDGDAPVVVVGGLNDPATPVRWAEEMTAAMGPSARLVTYTGEGHGFVLTSSCVTDIEAAVLRDLEVPDEGASCDPDPEIARPDWWDDVAVPDGVGEVIVAPEVNALLGLTRSVAFSELRTTSLDPEAVLEGYGDAASDAGFTDAGRQEPIPGVQQAIFLPPGDDAFSVLVIGPEMYDEPDLEGLRDVLADPTQTLVVLLALPL